MMKSKLTFLVATLWLAACASGREGLSDGEILFQEPVVNRLPGGAPEGELAGLGDAEAERALDESRDAFLRGDYRACLKTLRDALERGVPFAIATEMRALRFDAKRRLMEEEVLEARVLPDRDVIAMGESVEVSLALRNLGSVPVRVPRRRGKSSVSMFVLEIFREDWDIFGNVKVKRRRQTIPLEEDVEIPVGGRRSFPVRLVTDDPKSRHLGFTVYRIEGLLRPVAIMTDELELHTAPELRPANVRVLPPGYEPLAADPLGSIEKAHRLGAREHLLVATALVPPERREEAVDRLVSFLGTPVTPTMETEMAALKLLTGRSFARDPVQWTAWWREFRQ